jgi:hypothetical protein
MRPIQPGFDEGEVQVEIYEEVAYYLECLLAKVSRVEQFQWLAFVSV